MTFTPGYEIIDLEFPTAYEPVYPLRIDNKPVFTRAQFNEGIEQVRSWGENQLAREFVVEYFLPIADANVVDTFLQTITLYNKRFYWRAGSIVVDPIKVRCESWRKEFVSHNRARITATFIELFDYMPYNYGFFLDELSYTISGQDTILSKGKWMLGETIPYSIGAQEAALVFGRNLEAESTSLSITILPAGPEIYFLETENANDYLIFICDSTYVIGVDTGGDYFASMSAQVYGWDRDFQVDWWGD